MAENDFYSHLNLHGSRVKNAANSTAGTDYVTKNELDAAIATTIRKFAANIGNGSATTYAVVHNFGTRDVTIAIFDNSTFAKSNTQAVATDTNTVTVDFNVAPASNAFRVVIIG